MSVSHCWMPKICDLRFAVQRHEGQGAVGGSEIDTDAETR